MNKIIRYYISEIVSKSVANSQMFNWGEVLAANGLRTEFVIFYRSKDQVAHMTKDTTQPIIKVHIIKFFIIRNFIHFITLFRLYIQARKYDKVIFQTRTPSTSPTLAVLRMFPKVRVITDVRGIELEHFDLKSTKSRIKLLIFDFYTKLSIQFSDKVFCVSHPLVEILIKRYKRNKPEIYSVISGVADTTYFYFDKEIRAKERENFGLNDKVVLIYSGMLDKPWQLPEKYFQLFSCLIRNQSNLVLLLITPNIQIATELKKKFKLNDNFITIQESSFIDLVKFYNMADFGLLFRKDEIVNKVASPTKFSEYSLCGLPVIISANIGDFSDYIKETGLGYVIENTEHIDQEAESISSFLSNSDFEREKISSISNTIFSKQSQANSLLAIYRNL